MTCQTCEQEPCTCQKKLESKQVYIIQECSTPGCFTVIRSKAGQQEAVPICKWCKTGESHAKLGKPAVDIRLRYPISGIQKP